MTTTRGMSLLLNLGHALDHLLMLIFPTVVLAMSAELGKGYADLLPLSLGGFVAFGACSIPAGWLADRWSRTGMMTVFFFGIGTASILTGFATGPAQIALGLTLIGVFAAIYHPVGIAMLVANRDNVGRVLGVNGVFGNVGVAFSALLAGALAQAAGWRSAFIVPGAIALGVGVAFALTVRGAQATAPARKTGGAVKLSRADLARVFGVLTVATACGGVIFNATTISMPKVFDERLTALTSSTLGIGVLVCGVYLVAAMAQLCVGWWLDRRSLKSVFVPVVALQVPLLALAGTMDNYLMLATAVAMMFFVFGQIPINDAMIARYTAEEWRARAYAVRYVVSFGASALAVPLVAWIYRQSGDFRALYYTLGALAFVTFSAALMFPSEGGKAAVKELPA
ncbi:MAG TPA: MFS transporter [Burkholderiales bacterium]|nr:MFS transporter [Burkholderiales bacterium]